MKYALISCRCLSSSSSKSPVEVLGTDRLRGQVEVPDLLKRRRIVGRILAGSALILGGFKYAAGVLGFFGRLLLGLVLAGVPPGTRRAVGRVVGTVRGGRLGTGVPPERRLARGRPHARTRGARPGRGRLLIPDHVRVVAVRVLARRVGAAVRGRVIAGIGRRRWSIVGGSRLAHAWIGGRSRITRGRARTGSWRLTRMRWRASRGTLAIWLSVDQGARGVDRGRDDHPLAVRRLGGIGADLPLERSPSGQAPAGWELPGWVAAGRGPRADADA